MTENKTLTTVKTFEDNGVEVSLTPAMATKWLVRGSNLTEKEAVMFVNLCYYSKLNPFVGDAYLVKYGSDAQMIVSKQAALKLADRNPNRNGFRYGVIVEDKNGELVDRVGTFLLSTDTLLGAWCDVYRKDFIDPKDGSLIPITARVMLSEYEKPLPKSGKATTWQTLKATMICKVAIHRGHRDAFPGEYNNTHIAEEFGHTDVELRKVEGETVRDNSREKTVDVELPSSQVIKTHGITGFTLNAIQNLTDENDLAMKDLNYYLKEKVAENMVNLTEDEGEELKALLMDKYADDELEDEPEIDKPESDIESDYIEGITDRAEDEPDDTMDDNNDSDDLFGK